MIEYQYLFQYFGRMKKIVTLAVSILLCQFVFGQATQANDDVSFYAEKLQIEDEQNEALVNIINKKYNDLEQISSLRSTDEARYRMKRRNVYKLAENSIKLILTKEQLTLWDEYRKESRMKNAEAIRALQAKNASKEDLMDAQYGISN